jgi:hypothetical protein
LELAPKPTRYFSETTLADMQTPRISMANTSSSPGHRGAVRNPQSDGRLKHNRQNGVSKTADTRANVQHGGQGRVKNPGTDKRLKVNR